MRSPHVEVAAADLGQLRIDLDSIYLSRGKVMAIGARGSSRRIAEDRDPPRRLPEPREWQNQKPVPVVIRQVAAGAVERVHGDPLIKLQAPVAIWLPHHPDVLGCGFLLVDHSASTVDRGLDGAHGIVITPVRATGTAK